MNRLRQFWNNLKNRVMSVFNRQTTATINEPTNEPVEDSYNEFFNTIRRHNKEHPDDQLNILTERQYDSYIKNGFTPKDILNAVGVTERSYKENLRMQETLRKNGIDVDMETIEHINTLTDIPEFDAIVRKTYKELMRGGYTSTEAKKYISNDIFGSN